MKFTTKYITIILFIFLIFVIGYGYYITKRPLSLTNISSNTKNVLDSNKIDTLELRNKVIEEIKSYYKHTDSIIDSNLFSTSQLDDINRSVLDFNDYIDYFMGVYNIHYNYSELDSNIRNKISNKIKIARNQKEYKYHVVIGSFKIKNNAINHKKRFMGGDFNPYIINYKDFYCVSLISYYSVDEAIDHANFLKSQSIHKNTWVLKR